MGHILYVGTFWWPNMTVVNLIACIHWHYYHHSVTISSAFLHMWSSLVYSQQSDIKLYTELFLFFFIHLVLDILILSPPADVGYRNEGLETSFVPNSYFTQTCCMSTEGYCVSTEGYCVSTEGYNVDCKFTWDVPMKRFERSKYLGKFTINNGGCIQ
jgi:hypothetical protein